MTATPTPRRARPDKRWINLPPARAVAPERYTVAALDYDATGRIGHDWSCHLCSATGHSVSEPLAHGAARSHVGAAHDGLRVVTR